MYLINCRIVQLTNYFPALKKLKQIRVSNYQKSLKDYLLVIADRWARSSTSIATCTRPPSNCEMQGGTGASYINKKIIIPKGISVSGRTCV